MTNREEIATLGGGCFWCLDAPLRELRGVIRVESGYAGGSSAPPTYEEVCSGTTGHAEVVQVTFDPGELSYRELLEMFFALHDPTTPNRQGGDVGTQYRSVIFWHSSEQRDTAERVVRELDSQDIWDAPIVTELAPFTAFHPAEAYHQDYLRHNPAQPYCRIVVAPKLAAFRRRFAERLRGRDDARIARSGARE